jgi:hypothetical protein
MTLRLFIVLLCLPFIGSAQKPYKYWIEFTDKNNSPYCTCRPAEFLSARALERRAQAGIEVVENDLPVSPAYIKELTNKGLTIHSVSRWLNAAVIIADTNAVKTIAALPFVQRITYLGPHLKFRNPRNRATKKRIPVLDYPKPGGADNPLGYTTLQNTLLNLAPLYAAGHRGANIWVGVMDGGFTHVDTMPFFDSVALQGRLHPGWDFVERDGSLYESAQHGTAVLSVMAANLPGYFVGTAPDATYFLIKTEDTGGEFPVEETNWIAGAEWADSIGIDVINASLGYTSFNDTTLSHTFAELDGRTAIGSRGATIAATKGMIICNSAGNEGDGTWHYIGVPADAPGIIAVGAVDNNGARASFSSFGPSADGRIKPDLMAPGDEVVVAGNVGVNLGVSSGTSLASPMLTGALATLWSAFPEKTGAEIMAAVFESADQATEPDNARGYGLPDMTHAWLSLGQYSGGVFTYKFDRLKGELELLIPHGYFKRGDQVEIRDVFGRTVRGTIAEIKSNDITTLIITGLWDISTGVYVIRMANGYLAEQFLVATRP